MRKNSESGFSLLEVLIAAGIFALMLLATLAVATRGQDVYNTGSTAGDLENQARFLVEWMSNELQGASLATVSLSPAGVGLASSVTFQKVTGYGVSAPTLANPMSIGLVLASGETNNNADDNNNRLVDEGVLQVIENLGVLGQQVTAVKAQGVAEVRGRYGTVAGETSPTTGLPDGADNNGDGVVDEPGLNFRLSGNLLTIALTLERMGLDGALHQATVTTSVRIRNP